MADTPDPQSVGRELVRQYYTMLNERPDYLHRFFSQSSSYVHGGIEKPGEEMPPVKGQLAIHQKILSLGFKDCHAKIRQVDCQETVGGAVLIQVTGELSNNYGPMRRFMQTFVLASQGPKTFYLHNDIFRYQDEVFHDTDSACDAVDQHDATVVEEQPCENVAVPDTVASITESVPEQKLLAAVNSHTASVQDETPEDDGLVSQLPVDNSSTVSGGEPVAPTPVFITESPTDNGTAEPAVLENAEEVKKDTELVVEATESAESRTQLPVQKPFSWASLAGKGTTASQNSTAQIPTPPKPQATIKPERKSDNNSTQPLPQRTPRSGPQRPDHQVISDSKADQKLTSSFETTGDNYKQSTGPIIPDNQQLFVGNLPHNTEDKDLIEFFSKFGSVIDVKINRKGMTRDLPNFGFVSFDSAEAVQKALRVGQLYLYGKHRLNVEEKKEQSELFGRPRGRGRGRGSFRGPYRGGRGGHFSSPAQTTETVDGGSQH